MHFYICIIYYQTKLMGVYVSLIFETLLTLVDLLCRDSFTHEERKNINILRSYIGIPKGCLSQPVRTLQPQQEFYVKRHLKEKVAEWPEEDCLVRYAMVLHRLDHLPRELVYILHLRKICQTFYQLRPRRRLKMLQTKS